MRELTYSVATSLDGRIAAPDGDYGAFPVEGDHMAVLLAEFRDALPVQAQEALGIRPDRARFDTVVMGWSTYLPALEAGIPSPYPHLRQVVATRREHPPVEGVELTADALRTVRALKAEDGGSGIWLAGGGTLAGALLDEIDVLVLKINPVVLGAGIPVLGGAAYAPIPFERTAARTFDSGVIIAEYRRGDAG